MIRWTGLCFLLVFSVFKAWGIGAISYSNVFYIVDKDTPQPYIEVYWQVDPNTIKFDNDEKGHLVANIRTEVTVTRNENDTITHDLYMLKTTPAASIEAARFQNIIDLQRYKVSPGSIQVHIKLTDKVTDTTSVYEETLDIDVPPPTAEAFYSGIQLIDTAYSADNATGIFLKNNNVQVPLCANFLDDYRVNLHYYTELYGTKKLDKEQLPIIQQVYISKKEFDYPVLELSKADTLQPATVVPVLGRFRIDILPSGNYYVNIILRNASGTILTQQSVFFQRSNPHPVQLKKDSDTANEPVFEDVTVLNLEETFVWKYTPPQLMAILKMMLPISTPNETSNIRSFLKKPDATYMKYFIYNFFKSRYPADPDKGWENFTKQVKEVNKLFGTGSRPGYETERGMIYLKYGEPDQRYTVQNEQGALPYEVWQYNAPGKQSRPGAFLFYNPGFTLGEYVLLHSTVIGEKRNTNWRNQLYPNGASESSLNSRAAQTFQ